MEWKGNIIRFWITIRSPTYSDVPWLYNYKSTSNLGLVIQPFDLQYLFNLLEFAVACQDSAPGIPALVIPHLVDQFYWRQRVYELGAGPQLSADRKPVADQTLP